ncbi:MAG: hypothetical protein ACOYJD_00345 [Christensenellales bacterium]
MTDTKRTPTTSKEDTSRLGWKVSPITGREFYDFGEVDNYYLTQMLDEMDRADAEKQKGQNK